MSRLIAPILLVLTNPIVAQTTASPAEHFRKVTKSGEAVLRDLNQHGISLQGMMIYDWSKSVGDEDSETGFGRYSFDIGVPIDGKKLWGLNGSAALLRVRNHLNNFGEDCDDYLQLYSNIDASSRTTLYEAWIEQRVFSEKLRFKAGKIDANTEFASVQTASDFLNSSMGYSPTIVAFPTYPEPKLGINVFLHPTTATSLGAGIFETASSGALSIIEPGYKWDAGAAERPGRVAVGYWRLGGGLKRLDGSLSSGTQGLYSVVEQVLWHGTKPDQAGRKVSVFLQLGTADARVSAFERHVGAGAVLQGVSHKRFRDSLGAATTWVRLSSPLPTDSALARELIFEGYYKAAIGKHAALVQDIQFVHHPDALQSPSFCWIFTPRLVIFF